jgi:hypothetical protein
MPLALGNLLAAQLWDQWRYEHVRRAGCRPRERVFVVGNLVYQLADNTDVSVSRRAYSVPPDGGQRADGVAGSGQDSI